jgi:hypothetical protein
VAVQAVFLVMALLAVLVAAVPQLITQLFTQGALAILLPLLHHKVTLVVAGKELTVLTKAQEEAVERLLLEQTA